MIPSIYINTDVISTSLPDVALRYQLLETPRVESNDDHGSKDDINPDKILLSATMTYTLRCPREDVAPGRTFTRMSKKQSLFLFTDN